MPAIFNDQNRDIVREKMLQTGFELLKKYGVKRMTVSEIARACGLAKGTFYTLFPSKEDFIYQIIVYRRNMVKQKYTDMIEQYGQIGREQLLEFFVYIRDNDLSIYQYMTEQDMSYLAIKWPREYSFDPNADEVTTKWLMSNMINLRKGVNWKVLANFMKTIACMDMSKEFLHKDALSETRQMMCSGLLDYLFEKEN